MVALIPVMNILYQTVLANLELQNQDFVVFVLLSGKAELIIGIEAKRYALEEKKLYNVKKGIWHGLIAEENSAVLVIENDNTSSENTEYTDLRIQSNTV